MQKIGVLGSGDVGKTLSAGFKKHGYDVMIGTRDMQKLQDFSTEKKIKAGSFSDAAKFGEIVVLAVKGSAAQDALDMAGHANLEGKIVIDATNPIDDEEPPVNGVLNFFTTLDFSLMEELQNNFHKARFVKAFNSIGHVFMVNPDFRNEKPTMFICGNDDSAKKEVSKILVKFGFIPEDMGKAESARAIEPLCILWCIPGLLRNEWGHAFKLLKK